MNLDRKINFLLNQKTTENSLCFNWFYYRFPKDETIKELNKLAFKASFRQMNEVVVLRDPSVNFHFYKDSIFYIIEGDFVSLSSPITPADVIIEPNKKKTNVTGFRVNSQEILLMLNHLNKQHVIVQTANEDSPLFTPIAQKDLLPALGGVVVVTTAIRNILSFTTLSKRVQASADKHRIAQIAQRELDNATVHKPPVSRKRLAQRSPQTKNPRSKAKTSNAVGGKGEDEDEEEDDDDEDADVTTKVTLVHTDVIGGSFSSSSSNSSSSSSVPMELVTVSDSEKYVKEYKNHKTWTR